jgi:hypothetical protein
MIEGFIPYKFTDSKTGFDVHTYSPKIYGEDHLGILKPLEGSFWLKHIPVVTRDSFTHALNGWTIPLLREIGSQPEGIFKKLPKTYCTQVLDKTCIAADKAICFPSKKVPICYEASFPTDPLARVAASAVVSAWREGAYVFILGE